MTAHQEELDARRVEEEVTRRMKVSDRVAGPPTPEEILRDPAAPFWAQDLVRVLLDKDPVDVVNTLEVLAVSFRARLDCILREAG